ncbi:MAG: hypothetical protein AABY26_05975, partial [Nanoarchaeota archaeon]
VPEKSFWDSYQYYIYGGAAFIVLLIAGLVTYLLISKHKGGDNNFSELKDWVAQRKAGGASNEQIRQVLQQRGEWSQKDIEKALK